MVNKQYTHKHVYWKKTLPKRGVKATEDARKQLEGSRIISLEQLQGFIEGLKKHSIVCDGSIILNYEERAGLASFKRHTVVSAMKAFSWRPRRR